MFLHWHAPDLNSAQKWGLESQSNLLYVLLIQVYYTTLTQILQYFQVIYHPVTIMK